MYLYAKLTTDTARQIGILPRHNSDRHTRACVRACGRHIVWRHGACAEEAAESYARHSGLARSN